MFGDLLRACIRVQLRDESRGQSNRTQPAGRTHLDSRAVTRRLDLVETVSGRLQRGANHGSISAIRVFALERREKQRHTQPPLI